MQKVLRKRVLRDLKQNLLRYLALALLIVLCMYMVVSMVGAAETVITGVDKRAEANKLEDGEFTAFMPLTNEEIQQITDKGISLEKMFYLDYTIADSSTVRVFQNREKINLADLDKGKLAEKNNEVVLEKRYCEEHKLAVGDQITIGDKTFQITGIGSAPDYDAPYKNLSDSSVDSMQFGMAFVNAKAYEELQEAKNSTKAEEYIYAYQLHNKMTNNDLKDLIKGTNLSADAGISNLTQLVSAEDNSRVKASADDQVINKIAGMVAGVIIMVLFTYVISVFVIHGIEKESSIIGALYALGVKKRELMFHYLLLPVIVTTIAGMTGTLLGFSKLGVNVQMQNCTDYFSTPILPTVYPLYLVMYGIVMPPVAAAVVNFLVIQKKLSRPALQLIRNEQKNSKISKMNLKNMGFIGRFRIRQMLREARTGFTVIFGMFIALLIMMMGIDCYVMCEHISAESKADTKYEYMYTYKYPENEVPLGGEAAFAKTLKKERFGYNLDVTLLGIDEDNPYFNANVETGKNEVVISSAVAQKYNLSKGDELFLSDQEENVDYTFTIKEITQYAVGLYVFMDVDSMRELFAEPAGYYNVVFSDKKLDISAERLYAVMTKDDIAKSSDIFISKMKPLVYMMTVVSAIIFCMVMYLMMKVMIDRSAFSIALIKIFGYRTKEIRKLYLNGNFYIVAVGAAICIPLSKKIMDLLYPLLISNVSCGTNLRFTWQLYAGIYLAVMVLYLLINQLLVGRLKKMIPAEVLKNRE